MLSPLASTLVAVALISAPLSANARLDHHEQEENMDSMPAPDPLNREIHPLDSLINEVYDHGSAYSLERLNGIINSGELIRYLAQRVYDRLTLREENKKYWAASGSILKILASKKQSATLTMSPTDRRFIQNHFAYLLKTFVGHPEIRDPLVKIYDHFELWNEQTFWFISKDLDQATTIHEHWLRIHTVIPHLNRNQIQELTWRLQRFSDQIITLYLLNEIQSLTGDQMVKLLRLTSESFARTLELRALAHDEILYEGRSIDKRQQLIARGLNLIMSSLKMGHPLSSLAFSKAQSMATWSARRGGEANKRLLFFDLLADGKLDWNDHRTWDLPERQAFNSIDNKVVFLDFTARKRACEESLMGGD